MAELLRRLRYLLQQRRLHRELADDMEFHREMAARSGNGNFGNMLRLREQAREAWGWMWIDRLIQDLRYAARILRQSPGFTLTAVLVLAIGIGVNVTAFSLFNLIALKPLPIRDPESIVRLERRSPDNVTSEMPYASIVFYREHARTLSAVMATMGAPPMEFERDMQPVNVNFVTANYFSELGTQAVLGTLQLPAQQNAPPAVVLSYGFWQRRFGGDRSVIGRIVQINKKPATILGVTPDSFAALDGQESDVWLSLLQQPYFVEGSKALTDTNSGGEARMWARLAPGATPKAAEQELLARTNQLRKLYPKLIWDHEYILSEPGGHGKIMRPEMYQVAAMVGALVLLILVVACANLGGLMTARGISREHEISIRVAIGANRKRIFRQLFTESLLLAFLGSIAGLALSCVVMRVTLATMDAPRWMRAIPDWRVLLFTAGMSVLVAVLFGLVPAWQVARQRQRRTLARQILIAAQLAASSVLLIVAALLVRAAHHVLYTDPGFGYEQVFGIAPRLESHGYTPSAARIYLDDLKSRLRALPGTESVALSQMPMLGNGATSYMTVDIGGHPVNIYPNWVDPEFFKTMGIPLLRGRNLLPNEPNAVIVSESLARKQWPGVDALGRRLWRDGDNKDIIVGIAGNARIKSMSDGDAVEAYWPVQLANMPAMTLVVKTAGDPGNQLAQARAIVEGLNPKLFPYTWLLKSGFRKNAEELEKVAMVVTVLGLVAIAMAAIGIIGLVAYSVLQRTKEIAIRLALGAKRLQVIAAVLKQFCWPIALGTIAGLGTAAGTSKFLRKFLFGIGNLDPLSYAAAIAVLIVLIGVAAVAPVRRALRLDLARTLHYE
ncbi:MAG: ABC transporter permease [Acidobacteriaceae bacterium]